MQLVGVRGQQFFDPMFDASNTITAGGTAQLVLPQQKQRSMLLIQNISDTVMFFDFGGPRATATISSGAVTSCTVTNAGFGYTEPPYIEFFGGGNMNNSKYLGATEPFAPAPSRPAKAHAVLTAGAVTSIVIDDPGAGYAIAPFVFLRNVLNDPNGSVLPSATSGILLAANGGSFYSNGTTCTTDPVAILCATTGKAFTCKFMG